MTILVDSPAMILASVSNTAGGRVVEVLASSLIEPTDALYAAVRDILVSHCHNMIDTIRVPDPDWMFGIVNRQTFAVYDECPGTVEHVCLHERQVVSQRAC